MRGIVYVLAFVAGVCLYLALGVALARGGPAGDHQPVVAVDGASDAVRVKTADTAALEAAGAAILQAASMSRPGPAVQPAMPRRPGPASILGVGSSQPPVQSAGKGKAFRTSVRNALRRLFRG